MPPAPQQQMTPEQVEELKEKIKKMSPEELREFQKQQCIFCHIIAGKVQAKKVYEDNKVIGILDINPANPGHILLLPKEHYAIMPQVPEEDLQHLFMVSKALSNVALRSLEAAGTNIVVANGPAAGQKAQHFMIHVIPRQENDGINFAIPQKKHTDKDLATVAAKVSERLAKLMGITQKELTAPPKIAQMPKPSEKEKKIVEAEFKEAPETAEKKPNEEEAGKAKELLGEKEKKPKEKAERVKKTEAGKKKLQKQASKEDVKEPKVSLDDIAGLFK